MKFVGVGFYLCQINSDHDNFRVVIKLLNMITAFTRPGYRHFHALIGPSSAIASVGQLGYPAHPANLITAT